MKRALEEVRLDKWLWSVRIFKTRSLATEACKKGRVFINDLPAKPGRMINTGEVIVVRKPPVIYSYEVTSLIDKRQSASIASEQYRNLTPQEELDKLDLLKIGDYEYRDRGAGRPTKRERRLLDRLKS